MLAGVGFDFRRGAFQGEPGFLQSQFGIPEFQVFINVVQKREHGFVLHGGFILQKFLSLSLKAKIIERKFETSDKFSEFV